MKLEVHNAHSGGSRKMETPDDVFQGESLTVNAAFAEQFDILWNMLQHFSDSSDKINPAVMSVHWMWSYSQPKAGASSV